MREHVTINNMENTIYLGFYLLHVTNEDANVMLYLNTKHTMRQRASIPKQNLYYIPTQATSCNLLKIPHIAMIDYVMKQ